MMNMNLFNALENTLKNTRNYEFKEAAAYAAIIDADDADTKKLRARFGEDVVTKNAAIAAIYAAADMAAPDKTRKSRLLTVGRVVNASPSAFNGLAFRAADVLARYCDSDAEKVAAFRAGHPAAVTMAAIKAIIDNAPAAAGDVKKSDSKINGCHVATTTPAGTVEKARDILSDYFKTALATAKKSGDAVTIANVNMAIKAAITLGMPDFRDVPEVSEKTDVIKNAQKDAEKTAAESKKKITRSNASKKGWATRKAAAAAIPAADDAENTKA